MSEAHEAEEQLPKVGDHSGLMTLGLYLDVALRSELTGQEFRVLYALTTFANWGNKAGKAPGGNAFPTRKRIAQKLGRSVKTVDGIVLSLEKKGWIVRHPMQRRRDGYQTSNLYQFRIPADLEEHREFDWDGPVDVSNRDRRAFVVPKEKVTRFKGQFKGPKGSAVGSDPGGDPKTRGMANPQGFLESSGTLGSWKTQEGGSSKTQEGGSWKTQEALPKTITDSSS